MTVPAWQDKRMFSAAAIPGVLAKRQRAVQFVVTATSPFLCLCMALNLNMYANIPPPFLLCPHHLTSPPTTCPIHRRSPLTPTMLSHHQVIYAIKTRNGDVYLQLKRNFGDMSALQEVELSESELMFKGERSGGNYGAGTKEMQVGGSGWLGVCGEVGGRVREEGSQGPCGARSSHACMHACSRWSRSAALFVVPELLALGYSLLLEVAAAVVPP